MAQAESDKTTKKADKKKELDELNELFKPVVAAQKVSKGKQHTGDSSHASLLVCHISVSLCTVKLPM